MAGFKLLLATDVLLFVRTGLGAVLLLYHVPGVTEPVPYLLPRAMIMMMMVVAMTRESLVVTL